MTGDTPRPGDPSSDDEQVPSSRAAEPHRQSAEPRRHSVKARDQSAEASGQSAEPVLPRRSSDERDVGWGDEPAEYDDEWYRDQRPPHHG